MPKAEFRVEFKGGKIEFTPKGDWDYISGDQITFSANKPFIIQFIPESPGAPFSPFRTLDDESQFSNTNGGETSELRVKGGKDEAPRTQEENKEIEKLIRLNDGANLKTNVKLVARYRHAIVILDDEAKPQLTISKLGSWGC